MKTKIHFLGFLLFLGFAQLQAQQIPISLYQIANPRYFNVANGGAWTNHQLTLLHQQRGSESEGLGWSNVSDFVNYNSSPIFKSQRFGWGLQLSGDHIHSDTRIAFAPSISVSLIRSRFFRWGMGIYTGLCHWRSSFRSIPIFDSGDVVFSSPYNFTELDAGGGTDLSLTTTKIKADLGISLSQLPSNALTKRLALNRLVPHCVGYAGATFQFVYNFRAGPRIFYRNQIFSDTSGLRKGNIDIGLKAEFDRQSMWFTAAYRVHHAGWTAGFGAKIWERDTVSHPGTAAFAVNMIAMFTVPGRDARSLGPSAEIGLGLIFGQNRRVTLHDTLRDIGPIWESSANLTRHKDARLAPASPPGIVAGLVPLDSHVVITYEFPDDSRSFAGDRPVYALDSLLAEIGDEWVGMDNFIENVMNETVEECLSPELEGLLDKSRMDSLKRLMWIQLSTNLKWDQQSATSGPGIAYEGQLNPPGHKQDSLVFKVVYDERDTIVRIPPRAYYVNNFELAALKLYAMRKKMEFELEKYYAARDQNVMIVWEDEPNPFKWNVEADEIEQKSLKVVFIKKLRIESDHPKQKALQLNCVTLKFRRYQEGESRRRVHNPRNDGVYSDHGDPAATEKKHRKQEKQNSLFQRPDFIQEQGDKKVKRHRKNDLPPPVKEDDGLNH